VLKFVWLKVCVDLCVTIIYFVNCQSHLLLEDAVSNSLAPYGVKGWQV